MWKFKIEKLPDNIFKMLASLADREVARALISNLDSKKYELLREEFDKRKNVEKFTVFVHNVFSSEDKRRNNFIEK